MPTCRGPGKKEGGPNRASSWCSFRVIFLKKFIYYFLTVWVFIAGRGLSAVALGRLLIPSASLAAEHGLWSSRASEVVAQGSVASCHVGASWDQVSPARQGGFLTTGPPEVSLSRLRFFPSSPVSHARWGQCSKCGVHTGWFHGEAETVVLPRSERIHTQGDATEGTRSPAPAPSDSHPALPGPC